MARVGAAPAADVARSRRAVRRVRPGSPAVDEAVAAMSEIKRLMREAQLSEFDRLIAAGSKPKMAYLRIAQMSGYL